MWSARLSIHETTHDDLLDIVALGGGEAGRQACEALVTWQQRQSAPAPVTIVRTCSALPLEPMPNTPDERAIERRSLSPAQVALALMTARASNHHLAPEEAVTAPSQLLAASITRYGRAQPH